MNGILRLEEQRHVALWGEERWLASVHPAGPSVVASGPFAGRTLAEVCPGFPVLVKVIEARTRLSVQVHPNERTAKTVGGDPKTEMWCMLGEGDIYAGLKPGFGAEDVARAVSDGSFGRILAAHHGADGDVFFIPGGLVHAIGDDTRVFEVQQSSDTTYRLYDWNRVGADGRPRELHVEKGLAAIDFSLEPPVARRSVECPFFDFRKERVVGRRTFAAFGGYTVVYAANGAAEICGEPLAEGSCALALPGVAFELASSAGATVFVVRA